MADWTECSLQEWDSRRRGRGKHGLAQASQEGGGRAGLTGEGRGREPAKERERGASWGGGCVVSGAEPTLWSGDEGVWHMRLEPQAQLTNCRQHPGCVCLAHSLHLASSLSQYDCHAGTSNRAELWSHKAKPEEGVGRLDSKPVV